MVRIAERAKVSRGAQVHHFWSKTGLVRAVIPHLAAASSAALAREIGRSVAVADPLDDALRLLREVYRGPEFAAIVELWIAGRTDSALASELALLERTTTSNFSMALRPAFPGRESSPEFKSFVGCAMVAVVGALLANLVDLDPSRARRRWEQAVDGLRITAAEVWREQGSSASRAL